MKRLLVLGTIICLALVAMVAGLVAQQPAGQGAAGGQARGGGGGAPAALTTIKVSTGST
jgi:hypothetical protein